MTNNLSEEEKQTLLDKEEKERQEKEEALLKEAEQKTKEEKEAEEAAELEKRKKELEGLSDEEIQALLTEDEIKQLKELGFPQFKTVKELAENFKKFIDEDKMTFPIVKELASAFNMTPHQFINAVRDKVQPKKPSATPGKKPGEEYDAKIKNLEDESGNIRLDMRFDEFRRVMKEKDIDIPRSLKPTLKKYISSVLAGMTEEEITKYLEESLIFDDCYDLHLWKLSKVKDPEKLREGLKPFDAKRLAKLRQLGITPKKKTPKGATSQDVKDYGEGITKL